LMSSLAGITGYFNFCWTLEASCKFPESTKSER
jgi:hypothetical protein